MYGQSLTYLHICINHISAWSQGIAREVNVCDLVLNMYSQSGKYFFYIWIILYVLTIYAYKLTEIS